VPTKRGWTAFGVGAFLWIAARFMGSPDLHMIAAGVIVLPVLAMAFVRWGRVRVDVARHLSSPRVYPGHRVTVTLTVRNEGRSTISFMLLEDALPAALGRPARVVVTGIPSQNAQTVSYSVLCRHRGRFQIGPLSIFVADPFGLARVRVQTTDTSELVVYPMVEDLEPWRLATQGVGAGESAVRYLHRSVAEFYTMREYVTGDDLRRIHWPSVAHTGRLMIRQDESTRRSSAMLFLDNRSGALGGNGSAGFERAVSVTASVGRVLLLAGFTLTLATADAPAAPIGEEGLLELLAGAGPARMHGIGDALGALRASARAESTLAFVGALPQAVEVAAMSRIGTAFGRKLAVLVYPMDPASLAAQAALEYETRASSSRSSLQRSGWDVYLLQPDGRLMDVWQQRNPRRLRAAASSSS